MIFCSCFNQCYSIHDCHTFHYHKYLQVFDGIATSIGEVYVEQGTFSGRRRRRSLPAAASQALVHSSSNRERVLTRRLLSTKEVNGNRNDFSDSEYKEKTSNSHWPQSVSIYTVVGVLMVSTVMLVVSVVFWARQQQKSGHP